MENEESTFLILLRSIFAADSPISELAIDTVVSLGSIILTPYNHQTHKQ